MSPLLNNHPYFKYVVYINLDRRQDRKLQFQCEMKKTGLLESDLTRISAVDNPANGALGCTLSHIKAINYAKEQNWPHVAIFEDDFSWTVNPVDLAQQLQEVERELAQFSWDVIFLSCKILQKKPLTNANSAVRVIEGRTSSGYIVRSHYYDTILKSLQTSADKLRQKLPRGTFALDVYWKHIQQEDQWLAVRPLVGRQTPGFSDIQKREVKYLW